MSQPDLYILRVRSCFDQHGGMCTAARPTIEGMTNEDSKEVQTESLEITATPLLLLRAVQLGVHISEMALLTIETINDMYSEMQNDENQGAYSTLAFQADMDAF